MKKKKLARYYYSNACCQLVVSSVVCSCVVSGWGGSITGSPPLTLTCWVSTVSVVEVEVLSSGGSSVSPTGGVEVEMGSVELASGSGVKVSSVEVASDVSS